MSGKQSKGAHQNKKSRLSKHGVQCFSAGPHTFKTAARVKSRNDTEKFSNAKHISEKNKITFKRYDSPVTAKWNYHNRHQNRHKINTGSYLEDETGCFA